MKLLYSKINTFPVLYIIASVLTIIFELIEFNVVFKFLVKLTPLLIAFIFYKKKTNYLVRIEYILIFGLLFLSEILIIYNLRFFEELVVVKFCSTCIFVLLIKEMLQKRFFNITLKYLFIYLASASIIYYYVISSIGYISFSVTVTYISTCFVGALTFVDLMHKNSKKSMYYLIAVFLFSTANVVFAISNYIEESMIYVPIFYFLQLFGLYYFYCFMIEEGHKRRMF